MGIIIRARQPKEEITFYAHAGVCKYCGGIVKMPRDDKYELEPDKCWCLLCGQPYYVNVNKGIDLGLWEDKQWNQKI